MLKKYVILAICSTDLINVWLIIYNKKLIFHFLFRPNTDKTSSITPTSKKVSNKNQEKNQKLKIKKNLPSNINSTQEKKRKLNNSKESKAVKKKKL